MAAAPAPHPVAPGAAVYLPTHNPPHLTPQVLLAEAEASDVGAAVAAGDAGVLYDGVIRDRECAAVFGEVR